MRRPLVLNPSVTSLSGGQVLQASDELDVVQARDGSATAITTTTLADMAGLSFALEAGRVYRFEFEALLTVTGLASTLGFGVAYSGAASSVYATTLINGSVGSLTALVTAVLGPLIAIGATCPVNIAGRIRPTTAGNLTLQGQRSGLTASVAVVGSSGSLQRC